MCGVAIQQISLPLTFPCLPIGYMWKMGSHMPRRRHTSALGALVTKRQILRLTTRDPKGGFQLIFRC